MAFLTEKKFSFISKAPSLTEDTFAVVNFKGFEAISKPYEFDIMLVSDNPEIGISEVLQNPARFAIHRESGGEVHYNGILARFEQLHEYGGYVFYRALLVPKLWWLTLTRHNQVCLDNSVLEIIEKTLKDGGLTSLDFEFKTQKKYPAIDYVCQYGESHFNFVSRWAEREGIYYYFEQNDNGEKIIFTDTKVSHTDLTQEKTLYYSPPSGLDTLHRTETIKTLTCRQQHLPQKVFLKDYNYEKPSLGIEGAAEVDPNGRGEVYLYGEHFPTPEEGNRLAVIRAEEILCRKVQFFGESTVPFMKTGYTFTLEDHYRPGFNRKYLIEEVTHEGSQTGYLISGIRSGLEEAEQKVYYLNHFTAIPADVHYRPERKAEKPRIPGTIHASVDAEGSGNYAELDEQGRYKVRLPFDISGDHLAGKASSFVRMMQPYAGSNYGVHFPLHKGTEVLLSFVNGDPDRPVISGAVPNPETVSPVTDINQTKSIFRDDYGNELIFDATPGDEHIRLHCPHHNSTLELGRSVLAGTDSDAYEWKVGNTMETGAGNKLEAYAGNTLETTAGMSLSAMFGISNEIHLVGKQEALIGYDAGFHWGPEFKYHKGPSIEINDADRTSLAEEDNIISAKGICSLVGGASDNQQETTSLLNLSRNKIMLTIGNNKNPDQTEREMAVLRKKLMLWPLISTVIAALMGGAMAASIEHISDKKGRNAAIGIFASLEGITMLLSIVMVMYYGSKLKEKIKAVNHFDDQVDKVESLIMMHPTEGILLGTWPQGTGATQKSFQAQNVPKKDNLVSKIELKKDKLTIESKKNQIIDIKNVGDGTKKRTVSLRETYATIGCWDGEAVADKKGAVTVHDDGEIWIKNDTSDTPIRINSKGEIIIETTKEVKIKGSKFRWNGDELDFGPIKAQR